MSRNRYILDTPVGKVRTVNVNGARYYMIKDVCAGIGLTGHSPWSWHAKEAGNKERYYRRYDLERKCATSSEGRRNTATIITYNGLLDYLTSAAIRKRPQAMMFRTWLESQTEEQDKAAPQTECALPLEQVIEAEEPNENQQKQPEAPLYWIVEYICPICGIKSAGPTKFCADCGTRLML